MKKLYENRNANKYSNNYLSMVSNGRSLVFRYGYKLDLKSEQDRTIANFPVSEYRDLNYDFYETGVLVSYVSENHSSYKVAPFPKDLSVYRYKFYNNDGKLIWEHSSNAKDKTAKNNQFYYSILDDGIFTMEQYGMNEPEFKLTKYDGTLVPIKDSNLACLYAATLDVPTVPER